MGRGRKGGVGCESRLRVGSTFRLRKKIEFPNFFFVVVLLRVKLFRKRKTRENIKKEAKS